MKISEAFAYCIREMQLAGKAPKTVRNYLTAQNSLLKCTPDIPIALLSQDHISFWKDKMLSQGKQTSYIARQVSCLKGVLASLKHIGMNVLDPALVRRIKVKRKKPVYLEIDEVQALLDAAENPRDKAIFACLFSMGCRIGELLNLNREDVERDELTITNEKTGKDYPVFIDAYARRCLEEYFEVRKDKLRPLFVSGQYRRITVQRVEQIGHQLEDKIGLKKNFTPHVMRHTHATDLLVNGAGLREVQDALGHSSVNTTQMYTHIPDEYRREVRKRYHSRLTAD